MLAGLRLRAVSRLPPANPSPSYALSCALGPQPPATVPPAASKAASARGTRICTHLRMRAHIRTQMLAFACMRASPCPRKRDMYELMHTCVRVCVPCVWLSFFFLTARRQPGRQLTMLSADSVEAALR